LHLIVDLLRDEHAAGLGHRLQPRREVDAVAQQILAIDQHVAEVHADAKAQAPPRRGLAIELALHFDGALHRFDSGGKFRDQAVAGGVGDASAMALDQFGEHGAGGAERGERAHFVARHFA
jgi:hypothetical protein